MNAVKETQETNPEVKRGPGRPAKASEAMEETGGQAFEIPTVDGKEPFILVEGKTRYFEVIIREHDETKRQSIPLSDGFVSVYHVALGKKVILPESVINTARESVYTLIQTHQDPKTLKTRNEFIQTNRFTVEVIREVGADEARDWLREQKKHNINIF